ncbi:RagB/SusD family nutrient uptake outer membrane protein [Chitinophaga pinensis]|uniref:RagB/SusD domain protein n=1 Tax=Chitinophaga pinensis (strain ATCC 43595 / DSM 2588 / LMG 13176 / NBRC 15968 / NCIMB 11800 / UQM 2034) TaxID=485918 RepID=A0A979G781_CHIPD|nr:RagB/SusD family nutrient uptake outer membrane protein [Chitinophaga pinensis]ACU62051.1 RagB/SusD domain protein [Chitinophaga pinensis DSM 2588]
MSIQQYKKRFLYNNPLRCFCCICIVLSQYSCRKYLELDPPATSVNASNVYNDNSTAIAVVTAIYARMSNTFYDQGPTAISLYPELSADNLRLFSVNANLNYTRHYQNELDQRYINVPFWNTLYSIIYSINAAIEGLSGSVNLNTVIRDRLLGELYFLRAYHYFYLVNLYGDVPLLTSSIYQESIKVPRTATNEIYAEILADLDIARKQLNNLYVDETLLNATSERIRPNIAAVNALSARVYLYMKRYPEAEDAATKVISETAMYTSDIPLTEIFKKNSKETIWSLQPVKNQFNTDEGELFVLPDGGPNDVHPLYISDDLLNSFEPGDQRKAAWIGHINADNKDYPYPAKYKARFGEETVSEYTILLRLAEQYLIRAEARNEQNNTVGAIADLNVLHTRSRAAASPQVPNPLPDLPAGLTQTAIRTRILNERRVELFIEGGHRWFDIRRAGKIDEIMTKVSATKNGNWQSFKALYPIPLSDILLSPLLKQNPGYN